MELVPNKTVVGTGDLFTMDLIVRECISGRGALVGYVVVQTPQGAWFSFVWKRGGFVIVQGIKPAASGKVIPSLQEPLLRLTITDSLARGDYWFATAVFHAGDRITLGNWRSKAIYSSEVTITVR
jgi:hypothetical protein